MEVFMKVWPNLSSDGPRIRVSQVNWFVLFDW